MYNRISFLVHIIGYPPHVGCEEMALWSLSDGLDRCRSPLPIRVMTQGHFGLCTWWMGDVNPPSQPPLGGVTKISGWPPLEKKTKREKGRRRGWRKKLEIKHGPCPQGCDVQFHYLVSFKLWFHHLWWDCSDPHLLCPKSCCMRSSSAL